MFMTVRPIFICSNIKLLKMIKYKINTLILILSHVRQIFSFTGYNVNGREVPPWTEYKYFGDFPSDVINREYALQEANQRTYLMCPKDYFIGAMTSLLVVTPDQFETAQYLHLRMQPTRHSLFQQIPGDDFVPVESEDNCQNLKRCLGYQACVFNFGNEFCQKDPFPGARKILDANITCVKDHLATQVTSLSQEEIMRKKDLVLHIMFPSKLDEGVEDLENVVFTDREAQESFVFEQGCEIDPYKAGYRGTCSPLSIDNQTVVESTWHLTSRIKSQVCKERTVEVFCSFQYHRMGRCVPPHLIGNHGVAWVGGNIWSNQTYPQTGERPSAMELKEHTQIQQHPHKNLIPVKLAFALLVHKDVAAVIQLLMSIYRPYHFYVIHVDYRKDEIRDDLIQNLKQKMPVPNIRVLPKTRSFVTSWGSFQIVRAHLEQFEELARMGTWDFVINMSGSDLAIRNMNDLIYALAPYRGQNWFMFHGNVRNSPVGKEPDHDQGLCNEAWFACDGFVYNVTRTAGQPTADVLKIKTTSQWATLSYDFVDYVLSPERHVEKWRNFDYHMQTSVIPDESYLSTMALNGPFENRTHHVGLYWLKSFGGKDKYNLCKHLGEADFCGQGPKDIDSKDFGELAEQTHRYFFARKFPTNSTDDEGRKIFLKFSDDEYNRVLLKYMPYQVLYQLMQNAAKFLELTQVVPKSWASNVVLQSFHAFPKLHAGQPCCQMAFERHYRSVQEYSYVLNFQLPDAEPGSQLVRAKYNFQPQSYCYPAGDLRIIRLTGWSAEGKDEKYGVITNTPFPFHPVGTTTIFFEFFFRTSSDGDSEECKAGANEIIDDTISIDNLNMEDKGNPTGDVLTIHGTLFNPKGEIFCEREFDIVWDKEHVSDDGTGQRVEQTVQVNFDCGYMEAGAWKIRFIKKNSKKPHKYDMPILILPSPADMAHYGPSLDMQKYDLLQGFWFLEDAVLLPIDNSPEEGHLPEPHNAPNHVQHGAHPQHNPHHRYKRHVTPLHDGHLYRHKQNNKLWSWLVCQGGILALSLCGLISQHCIFRTRTRGVLHRVITVLLLSVLLQLFLCSMYCN